MVWGLQKNDGGLAAKVEGSGEKLKEIKLKTTQSNSVKPTHS